MPGDEIKQIWGGKEVKEDQWSQSRSRCGLASGLELWSGILGRRSTEIFGRIRRGIKGAGLLLGKA